MKKRRNTKSTAEVLERLPVNQPVILTRVEPTPFIVPANAGNWSSPTATAKRLGKLLDVLSTFANSGGLDECPMREKAETLRTEIKQGCEAMGWIVTVPKNSFRVRPPRPGYHWVRYGFKTPDNPHMQYSACQVHHLFDFWKQVKAHCRRIAGKQAVVEGMAPVQKGLQHPTL